MPGFQGLYEGREKIPVGREITDGKITEYWIEVKTNLTRRDEGEAQRILTQVHIKDGTTSGELDGSGYVEERVVRSVTDWNLTDISGEPIPLTHENILQLPHQIFELVANRVRELNEPRSPSDQAQFPGETGVIHQNGRRRGANTDGVRPGPGDVAEIRSQDVSELAG